MDEKEVVVIDPLMVQEAVTKLTRTSNEGISAGTLHIYFRKEGYILSYKSLQESLFQLWMEGRLERTPTRTDWLYFVIQNKRKKSWGNESFHNLSPCDK